MATEKWIAGSGQGLTYGNAFTGATLNSIASGSAILSDVQIDNSSALDIFADLSFNLVAAAFASPNFVGVYLYPLNADASTYGDGSISTSSGGTAATPGTNYSVGAISVTTSSGAQEGTLRGVVLPPGKFKFVLYNKAGVTWGTSGNTCQYRTYNRSIA